MAQGSEHILLLQKPWIWFPEPTSGSTQLAVTPASGDLMSSSALSVHLHTYTQRSQIFLFSTIFVRFTFLPHIKEEDIFAYS